MIKFLSSLLIVILLQTFAIAQDGYFSEDSFDVSDESIITQTWPYQLRFPDTSVIDNGDWTTSIDFAAGIGGAFSACASSDTVITTDGTTLYEDIDQLCWNRTNNNLGIGMIPDSRSKLDLLSTTTATGLMKGGNFVIKSTPSSDAALTSPRGLVGDVRLEGNNWGTGSLALGLNFNVLAFDGSVTDGDLDIEGLRVSVQADLQDLDISGGGDIIGANIRPGIDTGSAKTLNADNVTGLKISGLTSETTADLWQGIYIEENNTVSGNTLTKGVGIQIDKVKDATTKRGIVLGTAAGNGGQGADMVFNEQAGLLMNFGKSAFSLDLKNYSGTDINFQIVTDDAAQMFFVDGGTTTVTINGNLSTSLFNINGTGFINDKLIFTQTDGDEYIDSLADGVLNIVATTGVEIGNTARTTIMTVENDGDTFWTGSGTGLFYGNMDQDDTSFNVTLTTQNVWVELDAATTNIVAGPLNDITFDGNHFLKVNTAGTYMIFYSLVPQINSVAGGNQHIEFQIFLNSGVSGKGSSHVTYVASVRDLSAGSNTILSLDTNDEISIGARNTSSGGKVITIDHVEMSILKIGGTPRT